MKGMTLAALAALAASGCGTARTDADSATDSSWDDGDSIDSTGDHDGASTDTAGDDDGGSGDAWTEPETCTCPTGLEDCDGYCLDLLSNVKNCGSCGTACGTDQACIDGDCVALCEEMSFSTTEELATLLSDLSWVSTTGVMRYAVAGAAVSIASADVGDGYMFVSALAGVGLSSEILYGFDDSLFSTWGCLASLGPIYPSVGYGSMTVTSGVSFVADLATFGESTPDARCSDVYYCVWHQLPHPAGSSCCCTVDPFLWNILTLSVAPAICTVGHAPCDTEFAYTDHSLCRSDYDRYITMALDVNTDCLDHEHGCAFDGRTCLCDVMQSDIAWVEEGTCDAAGRCDTGLPPSGMYHDWEKGCY